MPHSPFCGEPVHILIGCSIYTEGAGTSIFFTRIRIERSEIKKSIFDYVGFRLCSIIRTLFNFNFHFVVSTVKFLLLLITGCLLFIPSTGLCAHGVSIDGSLKYPPDFKRFDYTSPDAVKGGQLVLHDLGSFDKMNPFTLKGTPPFGLETFVFETLAVPSLDEPFAEYGLIAKDIVLAPDKKSVTYTLNDQARFSDGTPITVDIHFIRFISRILPVLKFLTGRGYGLTLQNPTGNCI